MAKAKEITAQIFLKTTDGIIPLEKITKEQREEYAKHVLQDLGRVKYG